MRALLRLLDGRNEEGERLICPEAACENLFYKQHGVPRSGRTSTINYFLLGSSLGFT